MFSSGSHSSVSANSVGKETDEDDSPDFESSPLLVFGRPRGRIDGFSGSLSRSGASGGGDDGTMDAARRLWRFAILGSRDAR